MAPLMWRCVEYGSSSLSVYATGVGGRGSIDPDSDSPVIEKITQVDNPGTITQIVCDRCEKTTQLVCTTAEPEFQIYPHSPEFQEALCRAGRAPWSQAPTGELNEGQILIILQWWVKIADLPRYSPDAAEAT